MMELPLKHFKLESLGFAEAVVNTITNPSSNETNPANIDLFKGINRNSRKRCEICFKKWRLFGVFTIDFEHISNPFLVFLLLTLNN